MSVIAVMVARGVARFSCRAVRRFNPYLTQWARGAVSVGFAEAIEMNPTGQAAWGGEA